MIGLNVFLLAVFGGLVCGGLLGYFVQTLTVRLLLALGMVYFTFFIIQTGYRVSSNAELSLHELWTVSQLWGSYVAAVLISNEIFRKVAFRRGNLY